MSVRVLIQTYARTHAHTHTHKCIYIYLFKHIHTQTVCRQKNPFKRLIYLCRM